MVKSSSLGIHPAISSDHLVLIPINKILTLFYFHSVQFSSVAQSCLTLWLYGLQHARLPCPSPTPGVYSNSSPSSQWCHPTISSSVITFSSCLQSFPASGSLPMSQLFISCGQGNEVSASASVLPMNIQDWFPLGLTGVISLLFKGMHRWSPKSLHNFLNYSA